MYVKYSGNLLTTVKVIVKKHTFCVHRVDAIAITYLMMFYYDFYWKANVM